MAVVEEETFGPVAAVQVVESFDEALALAEGTPYGLAGDGFGYGPELLDELTRVRVVHIEPAP